MRFERIVRKRKSLGETAAARAVLTGHDSAVVTCCVSAEHGLVVSASQVKP